MDVTRRSILVGCTSMLIVATALSGQQSPVDAVRAGTTVLQHAQALMAEGKHDAATLLLGRYLAQQPNDGRAWFYLGRIYLADAQQWHRNGHPPDVLSATLLGFSSTSFGQAQELLADSGGVFRVVVAIERATLRIEQDGWESLSTQKLAAEELPLPPVLDELGRNLMASCPRNGVLLTGSLTESVAAWGLRLQGDRSDLVLLRPDMYRADRRYRRQMARALGADSMSELPAALATAAKTRPICLGPTVDWITSPGLEWHSDRLVLVSAMGTPASSSQFSMFHFARTGLTGSVWTGAARDVYDLAARRDRTLCTTMFANTDALTLPPIPACSR